MNIRFLICAYPLLILIAPMFLNAAESSLSTVRVADLPVYSNTSITSQVVKTLHQGDRVIVEFEIHAGQSWCKIREENRAEEFGYVMCQGLDRPQSTSQKRWNQVPSQSPGTADVTQPKKTDVGSPTAESGALRSVRDPDLWAERFKFSAEQRLKGDALLRSSGVPACKAAVEKMYRAKGISDVSSMLDFTISHGKSTSGMAEIARVGSELDRCGKIYGAFWKGFVQLLNSDQKAQLAKEPMFLLFLGYVNSDASTEFGFYVLSQMKSR